MSKQQAQHAGMRSMYRPVCFSAPGPASCRGLSGLLGVDVGTSRCHGTALSAAWAVSSSSMAGAM